MPPKPSPKVPLVFDRQCDSVWTAFAADKCLFRSHTPFQEAEIYHNQDFGKLLFLDGELQSASADEFIYHETLVHPAMLLHPHPRKVVILGGGEGGTVREVLRHNSVEKVWMIDLDGAVVDAARRFLPEFAEGAFTDPRCELVIQDAKIWLQEHSGPFDVIISDLTEPTPGSPSESLFSIEFFQMTTTRLNRNGVLALQASQANYGFLDLHHKIHWTLRRGLSTVRSMVAFIPSYGCHWGFAIATSNGGDPLTMTSDHVDELLDQRHVEGLKYYDGTTHRRLFSLPLYMRRTLQDEAPIITTGEISESFTASVGKGS